MVNGMKSPLMGCQGDGGGLALDLLQSEVKMHFKK